MSNNAPELSDLVEFVKQKKEGHLAITPKSGKAPVKVWFDRKPLAHEGFKCPFTFQDGVLYLGGEAKRSHAKGLRQTLKDEGWFNVSVALAGETVEVEGSEFDEVADEWAAMKKVLDRHPMTIPVQRRYDRVEKLMKASPPKIGEIRKAVAVLEPVVAKLKTSRGGHGRTSEETEVRVNDRSKIVKIRNAWARLERRVRALPMTRKIREDLILMEKLAEAKDPDEKALAATFERLQDFVNLASGKAIKAKSDGDATQKAVRKLLMAWQSQIEPDLNRIIASWVRARGEGAAEAKQLLALARKLPAMLQGETPDLAKAKRTIAFFVKAKAGMGSAAKAVE